MSEILQQEDEIQLDQENIRGYLDDQILGQIVEQYQHQGLTNQTISQYTQLVSRGCQLLHPLLPKLPDQKGVKFISQQELLNLDKTLLGRLESDQRFRTQREKIMRNHSQSYVRKFNVTDKSQSILNDSCCLKEQIAFQLDHNKTQLRYQEEQQKQSILRTTFARSRSQNQNKLPKIKTYPAKIDEEGQIMPAIKAKVIQVQQPEEEFTIPTHYLGWIDVFFGKWRPQMREGASLNNVSGKLYLFGGISSKPFNDVVIWDHKEWFQPQIIGEKAPFGRTNHVHCVYRRNIYIFGGEKPYDGQQKIRESTNDFRVFNTENNEFKSLRFGGELIEGRRGATGAIVGKHIIIHAGINTKGRYLSDLYHYDILNNKMFLSQVEQNDFFTNGIAFHTLVSVFSSSRNIQIYKNYMDPEEMKEIKYKVEGVYLFGGESKIGTLYSGLYILNPCTRPMQWSLVSGKGQLPISRYKHSASYCDRQGIIIIYGGISESSTFLNDCHIFKIETQSWSNVDLDLKEGRAGHSAVVDDHKLMIFGGYNETGFLSADFQILEIDSMIAYRNRRQANIVNHPATDALQLQTTNQNVKTKHQIYTDRMSKIREQVASLSYNIKSFIPKPIIKQISAKNLNKINKEQMLFSQRLNEETSELIKDFDYVEESKDEMKASAKLDGSPHSNKKLTDRRSISIRNSQPFSH
ncbi:unnamed protein product [Paramecium octaurelia]|uniref:Kelch motif family protein n=1 Tax=Paramecium octaurelia TaxID=43137 RepID=A0A8S1TFR8_PAROT|nr:unnamed protein product [Paramecium octaurelia]